MKTLARSAYIAGVEKNRAGREEERSRKELFTQCEQLGLERFCFATTNAKHEAMRLEVEVLTPERDSIDVKLLRELVDEETFLRVVSAAKKAVEEQAGKEIAVKATVSGTGTRNVFVRPAK